MQMPRFARPATDEVADHPVTRVPEPTYPVTEATTFDPEKSYRVKLSAVVDYLGTPLSPMHEHTVSGSVAEAVRVSIAAYALA